MEPIDIVETKPKAKIIVKPMAKIIMKQARCHHDFRVFYTDKLEVGISAPKEEK